MKPINFPEVTCTYAKDQPEYIPLPVYKDINTGEVVSCWQLTRRERWKIFFTGKLWISNLTFLKPLQPIRPSVNKSDMISKESMDYLKQIGEE